MVVVLMMVKKMMKRNEEDNDDSSDDGEEDGGGDDMKCIDTPGSSSEISSVFTFRNPVCICCHSPHGGSPLAL